YPGGGQDHIRSERNQFCRVGAKAIGITITPTVVDLQVAPDGPTQLLQSLDKGGDAALHLGIVRAGVREHADTAHALLGARRERKRRSASRHESHEFASLHHVSRAWKQ